MAVPLASSSTALAPAEIHCMVSALRCADEWHTAASPLPPRPPGGATPAPSGCGLRGSEAHPLSLRAPVSARGAAGRAAARSRGGATGAARGGAARRMEMDIVEERIDCRSLLLAVAWQQSLMWWRL